MSRQPLRVATLPNAAVHCRTGIVISNERQVIAETALTPAKLAPSELLSSRRSSRPRELPGRHATLLSLWGDNYYHWIADVLPRYLVLEELDLADVPLLIPRRGPRFQRDSLGLLGVPQERIVEAASHVVGSELLLWPARPAGLLFEWACQELGHRARDAAGTVDGRVGRRLYVSRRDARYRRVVNEEELVQALEPWGFDVVTPGSLSIVDQIRLFASAEVVVAPHGAALANALFMDTATVIEILDSDYVNPCYHALVRSTGCDYWYVRSEQPLEGPLHPRVRDLIAPIDAVVTTVARILR